MSDNDDELEVYVFHGNEGEEVPARVEKLIIDQGIQILPDALCRDRENLREVTLHEGLTVIQNRAFASCKSLQRIKLPSSVTFVGERAFDNCYALTEANLSTIGITEISHAAFACCKSLQTVSLPNTLERIWLCAFFECSELVTVVVPLENSQPIRIGSGSFYGCRRLANLELPRDSTAEVDSFLECHLLHERYGKKSASILAGLIGRFDHSPIHRVCYDHSAVTVEELQQCVVEQQEGDSLVDAFGMTPFHVFFSTAEPKMELLDVLLESLPNQILKLKDANGRQPMDYLINNWSDGAKILLQRTLQKWVIDRLARWGAMSWMEVMQGKVQEILGEDDKQRRATLCGEVCSALEHYESIEATSMLEMALWKWKLKSGRTSDGSKRQTLDRDECRCLSGSNVVIPRVTALFLDVPQRRR